MGLFDKKKKELPALISDEELCAVDYNKVLEWLVGLSGDDYTKVCQVAAIYRQSDFEASKVLGIENQATTFIHPPEPEPETTEPNFLDDVLDEKPKSKPKKVEIK